MSDPQKKNGISRRNFLKGMGTSVVGTATLSSTHSVLAAAETGPHGARIVGPDRVTITFDVNGHSHRLAIEPRETLLDVLRDHLGYTGSKRVCDRGSCGACTVILNGRTVLACSMLAIDADGAKIETVEGLATENLHPVQEAFVKHDAMQCGFCTPGFIMSGVMLLRKNQNPSSEQIKNGVSGNLCRCGTYPNVFSAIAEASNKMKKGG